MRIRSLTTAVLAVSLAAVSGCSGEEAATSDLGTTVVGATISPDSPLAFPAFSDPSAPIYVAVGRRFAISLEAEPAEGVRWKITGAPDPAVVRSIGTELQASPDQASDAPATQLLLLAAAGEGETTLVATLVSADDQPIAGRDPLTFTIVVSLSGEPPPPPPADPFSTVPAGAGDDGPDDRAG